jgi:GT2 family glycosyltransferase
MQLEPPSHVSVIVCVYTEARWDLIGKAVASLEGQSVVPDQVVMVVDHNERLLERARTAWPNHTVVANEHRRGLSGARNTGVAHATGAVVAFLDDDATAHSTWLEHLAEHFDGPRIAGVGGLVRPAWAADRPGWFPGEFLWVVGCSYTGMPNSVSPIRNPLGASMAFRRDVILQVGGFDEDLGRVDTLPVGCEETELSIRVRALGWEILYDPRAVVDHVVPYQRGRFGYFVSRCLAEGRSKAAVSRIAGASSALESERNYVRRVLPEGVTGALREGWHGPARWSALGRAGAIPVGLGMTAWGYFSHHRAVDWIGARQTKVIGPGKSAVVVL